jgi:hypothetical protein
MLDTMTVSHGTYNRIMEEGVVESVEHQDAERPRTAGVPAAGGFLGFLPHPRICTLFVSIFAS